MLRLREPRARMHSNWMEIGSRCCMQTISAVARALYISIEFSIYFALRACARIFSAFVIVAGCAGSRIALSLPFSSSRTYSPLSLSHLLWSRLCFCFAHFFFGPFVLACSLFCSHSLASSTRILPKIIHKTRLK